MEGRTKRRLKKLKVLKCDWQRDLKYESVHEIEPYDEHSNGKCYHITPVGFVTKPGHRLGEFAITVPEYYTLKMLKDGDLFTIQDPFNKEYFVVGNFTYTSGYGTDYGINPLNKSELQDLKNHLEQCNIEYTQRSQNETLPNRTTANLKDCFRPRLPRWYHD